MIRKEFIDIVTNTGMATLKELRRLSMGKDDEINEFELLSMPYFDENKFAKICSEKYGITFIDLRNAKVPTDTLSTLKKRLVIKFRAIPIQKTGTKVTLATFDPSVVAEGTKELSDVFKKQVEFILTNISSWRKLYTGIKDSVDDLINNIQEVTANTAQQEDIKAEDISDDVVTFVNRLLAEAFIKKASDIHVEPYEKIFRVRLRVDGNLVEVAQPPKTMMASVLSRLKIMAQMDISEKRKPQDGRIKLMIGGNPIDYRVSSLPTLFGEKIVLRLLDSTNLQLDMTKLGFEPKQLEVFKEGIHRPYGMCLVTGPTGSGKTTTLYSAIADLNTPDNNISTAEDPVEFNLEGINQVNVKKEVGLTFATALKAFLRQDPDIIMVGEIRDLEVGEIAVEAALTGHLVLSTLHTNDAPATITRLLNMGIEPFLVVAALNVIVAQRLCRKICINCREERKATPDELIACGFAPASAEKIKVYQGKGCEICNNTGYKGRVAIYEVLSVTPKVRELILRNASSDDIKRQAIRDGMKTLRMCALTKVAQGLTTLEEAVSNSASDQL
ncbi:GspE/PulE family protein [Peredibacter starrii]|uniref:ATPase, T2SS/T4P/T4SS family n=1 Tax=Peredibacter starrii TaxID=28202 RepID=A0AAX4HQS0_9BACT|nr:ATPase, T2SS/T4P/T4SS family [Peredibacter starrii]WPU65528.1 ATPase, T2SS/T4P/T4SS family [Peredibacter starrii]